MKRLAGNETVELVGLTGRETVIKGHPSVLHHSLVELDTRARLAADLASKWGPVLGEPDGYDDAGRQKMRTLSAGETAAKICDIVDALMLTWAVRGWLVTVPSLVDVGEMANVKATEEES